MIFPDTHEAIIDQDTWDIAQKLRVRAKPRAANGTYSHRLSGMIYCADCGSRMGFISPEARQSGKHYDSDSAFQCGNYRNQNNECVSHFIKTSALEAAILQAIKAVSQYVIENEAEFISQLKTVWNESKSKSANNGQQEIDEAKKRMAELDAKIQKLYDSAISGLLPERQAQRMIQQYDEEQLMLEKRVEELQGQIQEEEVEKIDTNRFIALVNKYRNCEELTDTMLYAFIDRVEVHEATGGRTVYRQQNIDIYFNFIGNYYVRGFLKSVAGLRCRPHTLSGFFHFKEVLHDTEHNHSKSTQGNPGRNIQHENGKHHLCYRRSFQQGKQGHLRGQDEAVNA